MYNRSEECIEHGKLCSKYKRDEHSVCINCNQKEQIMIRRNKQRAEAGRMPVFALFLLYRKSCKVRKALRAGLP